MGLTDVAIKIFYILSLSCLIIFGGYVVSVILLLSGAREEFYIPYVITMGIGTIVFFIIFQFGLLKKRVQKISLIIFSSIGAVVLAGNLIYDAYIESIEVVDDSEVDLYAYVPFQNNSQLATLEGEASLSLETELPTLDGATALYPVYSAFVQATYPESDYDPYQGMVVSTKTGNAYDRLISGEVDIIFAAGPSQSQLKRAERNEVELAMTPIGREAFVFFVNARNSVDELTIEEIQKIYSGEYTNWNQVGGADNDIRAFQRPEGSGSQTALQNLMGDIPLTDPPIDEIVSGMGGIIRETSSYKNYRNAFGYSFRFYSTEMVQDGDIKHIAVNGVYPSKETIRNGEYPISDEFYAITAGTDNPHVDKFIDWILSDEGQVLVEKSGYVPIK